MGETLRWVSKSRGSSPVWPRDPSPSTVEETPLWCGNRVRGDTEGKCPGFTVSEEVRLCHQSALRSVAELYLEAAGGHGMQGDITGWPNHLF